MEDSTIRHPALLARPRAYEREIARIEAVAQSPGLFDVAVQADGLHGHTVSEAVAVRAFDILAQAFGLPQAARAEWQQVLAGTWTPHRLSVLLGPCLDMLPALVLRSRTMAAYADRAGKGGACQLVWRRVKALDAAAARRRRLLEEVRAFAPHLEAYLPGLPLAHSNPAGLGELRRHLWIRGLGPAGWRWLVSRDSPAAGMARFFGSPQMWFALVIAANSLGRAKLPGPASRKFVKLLARTPSELVLIHDDLTIRPWLVAAAWERFNEGPGGAEEVVASFHRLVAWVHTMRFQPGPEQRRDGWHALVLAMHRAQGAAYLDCTFRLARELPEFAHQELLGVPLCSGKALQDEGRAMSHCIFTYASEAADGKVLAFSVRGTQGERIATMTFRRTAGQWSVHDCRGFANAAVQDARVHGLAAAILAELVDLQRRGR